MDAINAFEPNTFDQTAGDLTEGLSDEIITEVEWLAQQPKQVNIGEFDISKCVSVYLDEMVAKFGLEFPELDASRIATVLSDCGTSLNRHASNCGQISPNLQKSGFVAQQYLAVQRGEFMALKIQVEQLTKMFLKLEEEFHKSTETHQINPQTLLNERPELKQTEVEKEPPATIDVCARPHLRIEENNSVLAIERLPLYITSETKEVRKIENVHRNVTPLTGELGNDMSVIVARSAHNVTIDFQQEGLSSSHIHQTASHQENHFNQSQNKLSRLSDSGQSEEDLGIENVPRSVQPLSVESVIIHRSKNRAALDVEHHPGTEELVSSPHPTPLCQEDSLQTKQVRCGEKRKNDGNPRKLTHICKECNKGFSTKSNLKFHERIHNGEKPYKCGYCDAAFVQKGSLTRHQTIHNGRKLYKCRVCKEEFLFKIGLRRHSRTHAKATCKQKQRFSNATTQKDKLL